MLSTDPIDILRDASGDIVNPPVFSSGPEGVRQQLIQNVRDSKGEWFLNRDIGPAWLPNDIVDEGQSILGNPFDEVRVRTEIRAAIFRTVAVTEIVSMSVEYLGPERGVRLDAEIKFVFDDLVGTLTISETF